MIDTIKMTPAEYSKESRDYQVVSRLFTSTFNNSKMFIDNTSTWNNNIDNKLVGLRAKSLNYQTRHLWNLDDLESVTSCFKYLMLRKGTIQALVYCINILMRIKNISGAITADDFTISNGVITLTIPQNIISVGNIEDLFDYLLPTGLTYRIITYKKYENENETKTIFGVSVNNYNVDSNLLTIKNNSNNTKTMSGSSISGLDGALGNNLTLENGEAQ